MGVGELPSPGLGKLNVLGAKGTKRGVGIIPCSVKKWGGVDIHPGKESLLKERGCAIFWLFDVGIWGYVDMGYGI